MTIFNWEDIDHSLVGLKLTDLAEEMHKQIDADERRIQFENRLNLNTGAVPSLILQMKEQRADEWARRAYEIYCDVWRTQGRTKSGSFVRSVSARGIAPMIRARTGAIAWEFALFAQRTSLPTEICKAQVDGLRLRMQRLEDRWRRRLEVEAKECDHAERTKRSNPSALDVSSSTENQLGSSKPSENDSTKLQPASSNQTTSAQVATWDAIEISFTSEERVQIRNGATTEIRNYTDFGFEDGRSGKPNRAWQALQVLAAEGGVIRDPATMGMKWPNVEKRIQEIRKVFRKHFGISSDPIPFVEGSYQAQFKIGCSPSFYR